MASLNTARSAINDLCSTMKADNAVQVVVQGAQELSNGFARVVATVTHANGSRDSKNALVNALRSKFNNKLHVVQDSFSVLSSNTISDTVVGIMSLSPESIAYTEGLNGFKSVAGNMFMDDEQSLWALRKTEAGNILVKAIGADDADVVGDLLQSVSSVDSLSAYESLSAVQSNDQMLTGVQGGDFITYVCPSDHRVVFGAAIASVSNEDGTDTGKLCVIDKDNNEKQIIDRGMVLAAWADVEVPEVGDALAATESTSRSIDDIAAYYKTVFQRDPSYYDKFMARWREHTFS